VVGVGRMCFDGVNNYVDLASIPVVTGIQIIEFCCFLPIGEDYTGANSKILVKFDNNILDHFAAWMLDLGAGSLMNIQVRSNDGLSNQRIPIAAYEGAPLHVKVGKAAGSINYIEFNGTTVSGATGSAMGYNPSKSIGWVNGGLASYYFYGAIWDVKIEGSHWWKAGVIA